MFCLALCKGMNRQTLQFFISSVIQYTIHNTQSWLQMHRPSLIFLANKRYRRRLYEALLSCLDTFSQPSPARTPGLRGKCIWN